MVFGLVSAMVLLIAAPAPAFNVAEQPVALDLPVTWQPVARQAVASQHIDWRQEAPAARVDVNRADAERLQTVPGIGPATAGRIVDWRNEHGRFERLEDLLNIRGIGGDDAGEAAALRDGRHSGRSRRVSPNRACCNAGSSIIEVVVVLAVFGIVVQTVAPAFVRWRQARRLEAAAEELVLFAIGLRTAAAAAGASRGIAIDSTAGAIEWTPVADGDGDGPRRADLRAGRDIALGPPRNVSRNYPGVIAGLPPGVRTPTGGTAPADGIAFGRGDLLSLSADGTATSGSLYLQNQFGDAVAVRVYGATARFSLWRRRQTDGGWRRRW